MTAALWCALAAAVWAASAVAAPAHPAAPDTFASCQTQAQGVEPKLKACAATEIDRRDAALNDVYKHLVEKVGAARQPALRAAERAWLGFGDAECAFRMAAEAPGSNAALLASTCRLELTSQRVEQLRQALKVASF